MIQLSRRKHTRFKGAVTWAVGEGQGEGRGRGRVKAGPCNRGEAVGTATEVMQLSLSDRPEE